MGFDLTIVVAAPLRDITGFIDQMTLRVVVVVVIFLLLIIPVVILLARKASKSMENLVEEAEKIQNFDFSISPVTLSNIAEVNELAKAFGVMRGTIQAKTDSLEQIQKKLEMLVTGNLALSAESSLERLVSMIFQSANDLVNADGGALYLIEGDELEVELLSLYSHSHVLGGLSDHPAPRVKLKPAIAKFLSEDSVLHSAGEAFDKNQVIVITEREMSLFPTGLEKEPKDYHIESLIAIPIVTRHQDMLGVIQLFNPSGKDVFDENGEIREEILGFVGSLASQAAVTLDNRNLVNSLRNLFDAIIQVVASAIDAKSPYTGGHCSRVPVLAEMLAKAANDTDEGPLKEFRMESEDDWRELHIAAWLHDCGKVSTPEYVVDKATKLETIYNRIHEVRTRFEVLRRDAELEYYRRLAAGEADIEALQNELESELMCLEEDFSFIATCNVGGEFMSDVDKERLRSIAKRQWKRHYSDRMGISNEELRAKEELPEPELPVTETLLADKEEHLVPRINDYSDLKDIRGNAIEVPEYESNHGEIYNLCIERGTLTEEERFKINEHAHNGLSMLKKIPFPKGLRNVPAIAASHHETLIGTGYPLKKTKDDLSVESRIMAIADVFEALTASDRPYKKSKTVSEALRIMEFMRKDQHLDPDLLDIFLSKGVFKQYADMHLKPEQNDIEDITPYIKHGQ